MKCKEFEILTFKDPEKCSSTERFAFVKHINECEECRIKLNQEADLIETKNGKLSEDIVNRLAKIILNDFAKAKQDPELL